MQGIAVAFQDNLLPYFNRVHPCMIIMLVWKSGLQNFQVSTSVKGRGLVIPPTCQNENIWHFRTHPWGLEEQTMEIATMLIEIKATHKWRHISRKHNSAAYDLYESLISFSTDARMTRDKVYTYWDKKPWGFLTRMGTRVMGLCQVGFKLYQWLDLGSTWTWPTEPTQPSPFSAERSLFLNRYSDLGLGNWWQRLRNRLETWCPRLRLGTQTQGRVNIPASWWCLISTPRRPNQPGRP